MSCPCEVCKHERAQRREARAQRAAAREAQRAEAARRAAKDALTPMEKNHMRIGAHVAAVTMEHLDDTWTSQDGRTVKLQGMSLSHLYYAAAKMCREGRQHPQKRLESEILRRLARAHYPQSYREPNEAGNYRDDAPLMVARGLASDSGWTGVKNRGILILDAAGRCTEVGHATRRPKPGTQGRYPRRGHRRTSVKTGT